MAALWDNLGRQVLALLQAMGPRAAEMIWLAGGILLLLAWLWLAHRVIRRLLGHHRYRGTWYSAEQYRKLMQALWDDQQTGRRVLSHTELHALRTYLYGTGLKPIVRGKGGGYFDA